MPILGTRPYPILRVEGDAYARGYQHGQLAADRVALSVERYMKRFEHFAQLTQDQARDRARQFREAIEAFDAQALSEIRGIAEGAGQHFDDLLAVNCRSEVMFARAPMMECTSFGIESRASFDGHTYVGQNWDWAPDVKDTLILLVLVQTPDRPDVILLDEAGMIGRMGMNSAGIALATNTLISEQHRIGVPYNILLRGILNSSSLAAAIGALAKPERAISANYMIGHGSGQIFDVETSPIHTEILYPENGVITHGNHFLGSRLVGNDLSLQKFPDSAYRHRRLRDGILSAGSIVTRDAVKFGLRDSFGTPDAVCRHSDPSQNEFEQLETVASIIMDATDLSLSVCKGAPDENEYHSFRLTDLVKAPELVN